MEYIIFGAGETGRKALLFLGYGRTKCFVSNNPTDERVDGKQVISFEEMLNLYDERKYIIVVASELYCTEMIQQLIFHGINVFLPFHERDVYEIQSVYPQYPLYMNWNKMSYSEIIARSDLGKYDQIAIWGSNRYLHYLIAEIIFQKGIDSIKGIVLTDEKYCNTLGCPVIQLNDIKDSIDCLILNERWNESSFAEIYHRYDYSFDIISVFDAEPFTGFYNYPRLKKFKDIHKGQKCFIIGNGPSLRAEDLDVLHKNGWICFGVNRIYKIFNDTKWRPTYYGIGDYRLMEMCRDYVDNTETTCFISDAFHRDIDNRYYKESEHLFYWHLIIEEYVPNMPRFSSDISQGVYWGGTVVYDLCMQFAAYMGFSEIYLLGVDNTSDNRLVHFCSDYLTKEEEMNLLEHRAMPDEAHISYEAAERYSRKHGFRIFNATRGGSVEAFERVDFDSIFKV